MPPKFRGIKPARSRRKSTKMMEERTKRNHTERGQFAIVGNYNWGLGLKESEEGGGSIGALVFGPPVDETQAVGSLAHLVPPRRLLDEGAEGAVGLRGLAQPVDGVPPEIAPVLQLVVC